MKRTCYILVCFLLCLHAVAQIESEGFPTPMPTQTYSRLRSVSSFYTSIQIDTTQNLDHHSRQKIVGNVGHFDFTPDKHGTWETLDNNLRIWRMGIVSSGAASISLVLDQIDIPEEAKFLVYNPTQTQVLGAFGSINLNSQGILPIRPLPGDSLIIEYQEPLDAPFSGSFRIERIAHNRATADFNVSNSCSPHANFTNDLQQQKQAVCLLYVVSKNNSYFASGCLINNTEGKPYIYTAAHNLKAIDDATRTIFYFNYAVTAQDSTIRGSEEFTIAGSSAKAWATDIDMALLELNQMPPKDYRVYLAGWTRSKTPQPPFISIQHPAGDSKKMSYLNHTPTISNYPGYLPDQIKNGWWYINRWSKGTTEAGSSGSPLFEKNGLIIGALTGGSSTCLNPSNDYYARLDTAWNHHQDYSKQLAHWLSPNQPQLSFMEGIDPYANKNCERLTHIDKGDKIVLPKHQQGYYSGHNQLKNSAFAEKFTLSQDGWIYGAYIMPAMGRYNINAPVYLCIYDGNDTPKNLLAKKLVKPVYPYCTRDNNWGRYIKVAWSNKENYIRFDQPVAVPNQFFVGVEVQYDNLSNSDTLALYSAIPSVNYAFYKDNETWKPFSQHNLQPMNLSLWIEPVITYQEPTAIPETGQYTAKVYPNPTAQEVFWDGSEFTSFQLYNLQGKLIDKGEQADRIALEQPGVYVLYLYNKQHNCSIHKVIRY